MTHSCPSCTARFPTSNRVHGLFFIRGFSRRRLHLQTVNSQPVDASRCRCAPIIAVGRAASGFSKASYRLSIDDALCTVSVGDLSADNRQHASAAEEKRLSPFARLRSGLRRRCLQPPSIGGSRNSRMELLRTAGRGPASSDVLHLQSRRRMAAPVTPPPMSRNAEQDTGEGESMNEDPSGDNAEMQSFGKVVAFGGG